ncbi:hypothetical protein V2J09_005717 [Rumex salicifolius]
MASQIRNRSKSIWNLSPLCPGNWNRGRHCHNFVGLVVDDNGNRLTERLDIASHFSLYFENLLGNSVQSSMRKEKEARRPIPTAVKVETLEEVTEEAVTTTLRRGIDYLCSIQAHDGHWPAEFAGPLFFMPPLIMALYLTKGLNTVLSPEHQHEIKRYIYNHQNEDGGWGLHIEGHSTMFGSSFNYVALRILGDGPDDDPNDAVSKARKWILDHGGAINIPSWGKFFLALLGVYDWHGCNPLPPELSLLPGVLSFPGKMLSYSRLVYMPMSYLYGKRFVGEITPLIQQLRQELYLQPYHQIKWSLARNTVSHLDIYYSRPPIQDLLWGFLYNIGEPILGFWPFSKLREMAMNVVMEHIHYEDINSNYLTIGCIIKILCLISCWLEDPNSEAYKLHLTRIPDYLWVAEDGMKVMGTPGSQTWDVPLAVQAILSSNLAEEYGETLCKAHEFIKASQVMENPSHNFKKMYRFANKGAWTFSTQDQGWQVSDCTADSLKVALLLSQIPKELVGEQIETSRIYEAIDVLLKYQAISLTHVFTLQSNNGGFPAWEPTRTYHWVEKLNPTEVFEDCLIEKEHVECTSAVIQALSLFKKLYPEHRRQEIDLCIKKGLQYILDQQNPDGSRGSWGICYTYGTWYAIGALTSCGMMSYNNSLVVRRACEFLLSKQLFDGGWGESYLSYTNKVGIDPIPIKKGVKLLINSQKQENGDFPQQHIRIFILRGHLESTENVFHTIYNIEFIMLQPINCLFRVSYFNQKLDKYRFTQCISTFCLTKHYLFTFYFM